MRYQRFPQFTQGICKSPIRMPYFRIKWGSFTGGVSNSYWLYLCEACKKAVYSLHQELNLCSGRSRMSHRWHGPNGGVDLQCGCFLVKMFAKMKELGPVEGRAPETPPRSANAVPPGYEADTVTTRPLRH